jgi:hypothetical protein
MLQFRGDADNDGRITVADIPLALRVVSGIVGDSETRNRVDANGDGTPSIDDIRLIVKHIEGETLIDGVILVE